MAATPDSAKPFAAQMMTSVLKLGANEEAIVSTDDSTNAPPITCLR